ncbi:hypothetical protein MNEG_8939 [Monoraphidium neglectum]|uniref:Pyrrolo-quinoline quinone repeat domain-containing protein n=1 Tax=Monoraphidium neglectum TaxID=145388 RepID=A0A0D2ME49_9CHLO|nr:hypothetical protein MNEG_8939 [Monoraphidium neglectum]KIY99021.1 hypothetical protein MNEG_8939 [Monoraphidium neglectum]|eukprot:XP_013898041.1 hypothetical protein MNEG_8939 [Monoraphidium neglectum]
MPGHYMKKTSCTRCPKNHASPGGSKTTACTKCLAPFTANPDQSECIDRLAWSHWGGDLSNRRWSQVEKKLTVAKAGKLKVKWEADVAGSTSATPTIHNGFLYVPDWEGNVFCLKAATGEVVWSKQVKDYISQLGVPLPANLGVFPLISRNSPVIYNNELVILGTMQAVYGGYAFWLALRASDGALVWGKQADTNIAATITQSPTLYEGVIYTGISSLEENVASRQAHVCCSFRGSAAAVDARTGDLLWQTFTAPDIGRGANDSWAGASIWGSSPVVDRQRGQIIVATANNYRMPLDVEACLLALGPLTVANSPQQKVCMQLSRGNENHHNSILALDMKTGAIKWATPVDGPDAWNAACLSSNPAVRDNCPAVEGPDFAFGQAPMLVTPCKPGKGCKQLLIVGQKSGIVWALDPNDGSIAWNQRAGPGGLIGGLMWGSASDNKLVYVSNNNMYNTKVDFQGADAYLKPVPNVKGEKVAPASTNGGLCVALDAWDGTVRWTFANPMLDQAGRNAKSLAAITVANGVLTYASMDPTGRLFMLRATDGKLLGSYDLGASSACGPSIVDGVLYSGTGYTNFALGTAGTKVIALTV